MSAREWGQLATILAGILLATIIIVLETGGDRDGAPLQFVWWGWSSWQRWKFWRPDPNSSYAKIYRWGLACGPLEIRRWAL